MLHWLVDFPSLSDLRHHVSPRRGKERRSWGMGAREEGGRVVKSGRQEVGREVEDRGGG